MLICVCILLRKNWLHFDILDSGPRHIGERRPRTGQYRQHRTGEGYRGGFGRREGTRRQGTEKHSDRDKLQGEEEGEPNGFFTII